MQVNLTTGPYHSDMGFKPTKNQSYSSKINFGRNLMDVFERPAVVFTKEQYIIVADKLSHINLSSKLEKTKTIFATVEKMNKHDPMLIELKRLGNVYKKSLSIEDKKLLLKHEEKIHWQELETPEIGIVRNYHAMADKGINKDLIPAMNISNLNGLGRLNIAYDILGLKLDKNPQNYNLLAKLIKKTPDGSPFATEIKTWALSNSLSLAASSKDKVNLANYIIKNTKDKNLQKYANSVLTLAQEYNESKTFSKLFEKGLTNAEKVHTIVLLAQNKSKKLAEIIPSILNSKKTSPEIRLNVIWAAGHCKSKENFDLLFKIANDKSKKPDMREMALHSLAKYLRTNESEVKNTLQSVIDEKSDLSELAQILLEKTEGRYYIKDKELAKLSENEKARYIKLRDKYINSDTKLNIQQTNAFDRALLPLAKTLKRLTHRSKISITIDTITKIFKEDIATRAFSNNPAYRGEFRDSITGLSSQKSIIVNKSELKDPNKYNIIAHEFNHNFYRNILDENDSDKLASLYKNAVIGNRCLDRYTAIDIKEYFAQGNEAYCSVYKPHEVIYNSNDYILGGKAHLRSTLKRNDPELYDFIEYCIKKYNS